MAHHTCDYLIIGNSAAGVTAAEFLSAAAPDKSIIMVSHEPYRCYGRPLISYLLEGKTDREHLDYKSADFYETRGIETLFGIEFEAVALDASAHEVKLAGGEEISYGKCLLATGSVPFIPPIAGMEGRTNVHTFITLDDALAAWDDVLAATERAHAEGRESRVVVIGGGLIGMKAAEALSHHADRIDVFDRSPRILPAVLDVDGAAVVSRLMEPHGIFCHPSMSVDEMLGEGERVTHVRLTDGSDGACDMVIVAVGVRPASKIAVEAGAEQGRGLICGPDLQTSLPDVYAAGDVTQVTAFCERSLFLLSPHAESTLRLLPSYVEPPQLPCGVNAFETHITLRCNMRVTFVKRCIHTLKTLHSLPSPCGAAHRHALVATRPPRLELPGLGQWGK